jgi:hypothetical protein
MTLRSRVLTVCVPCFLGLVPSLVFGIVNGNKPLPDGRTPVPVAVAPEDAVANAGAEATAIKPTYIFDDAVKLRGWIAEGPAHDAACPILE